MKDMIEKYFNKSKKFLKKYNLRLGSQKYEDFVGEFSFNEVDVTLATSSAQRVLDVSEREVEGINEPVDVSSKEKFGVLSSVEDLRYRKICVSSFVSSYSTDNLSMSCLNSENASNYPRVSKNGHYSTANLSITDIERDHPSNYPSVSKNNHYDTDNISISCLKRVQTSNYPRVSKNSHYDTANLSITDIERVHPSKYPRVSQNGHCSTDNLIITDIERVHPSKHPRVSRKGHFSSENLSIRDLSLMNALNYPYSLKKANFPPNILPKHRPTSVPGISSKKRMYSHTNQSNTSLTSLNLLSTVSNPKSLPKHFRLKNISEKFANSLSVKPANSLSENIYEKSAYNIALTEPCKAINHPQTLAIPTIPAISESDPVSIRHSDLLTPISNPDNTSYNPVIDAKSQRDMTDLTGRGKVVKSCQSVMNDPIGVRIPKYDDCLIIQDVEREKICQDVEREKICQDVEREMICLPTVSDKSGDVSHPVFETAKIVRSCADSKVLPYSISDVHTASAADTPSPLSGGIAAHPHDPVTRILSLYPSRTKTDSLPVSLTHDQFTLEVNGIDLNVVKSLSSKQPMLKNTQLKREKHKKCLSTNDSNDTVCRSTNDINDTVCRSTNDSNDTVCRSTNDINDTVCRSTNDSNNTVCHCCLNSTSSTVKSTDDVLRDSLLFNNDVRLNMIDHNENSHTQSYDLPECDNSEFHMSEPSVSVSSVFYSNSEPSDQGSLKSAKSLKGKHRYTVESLIEDSDSLSFECESDNTPHGIFPGDQFASAEFACTKCTCAEFASGKYCEKFDCAESASEKYCEKFSRVEFACEKFASEKSPYSVKCCETAEFVKAISPTTRSTPTTATALMTVGPGILSKDMSTDRERSYKNTPTLINPSEGNQQVTSQEVITNEVTSNDSSNRKYNEVASNKVISNEVISNDSSNRKYNEVASNKVILNVVTSNEAISNVVITNEVTSQEVITNGSNDHMSNDLTSMDGSMRTLAIQSESLSIRSPKTLFSDCLTEVDSPRQSGLDRPITDELSPINPNFNTIYLTDIKVNDSPKRHITEDSSSHNSRNYGNTDCNNHSNPKTPYSPDIDTLNHNRHISGTHNSDTHAHSIYPHNSYAHYNHNGYIHHTYCNSNDKYFRPFSASFYPKHFLLYGYYSSDTNFTKDLPENLIINDRNSLNVIGSGIVIQSLLKKAPPNSNCHMNEECEKGYNSNRHDSNGHACHTICHTNDHSNTCHNGHNTGHMNNDHSKDADSDSHLGSGTYFDLFSPDSIYEDDSSSDTLTISSLERSRTLQVDNGSTDTIEGLSRERNGLERSRTLQVDNGSTDTMEGLSRERNRLEQSFSGLDRSRTLQVDRSKTPLSEVIRSVDRIYCEAVQIMEERRTTDFSNHDIGICGSNTVNNDHCESQLALYRRFSKDCSHQTDLVDEDTLRKTFQRRIKALSRDQRFEDKKDLDASKGSGTKINEIKISGAESSGTYLAGTKSSESHCNGPSLNDTQINGSTIDASTEDESKIITSSLIDSNLSGNTEDIDGGLRSNMQQGLTIPLSNGEQGFEGSSKTGRKLSPSKSQPKTEYASNSKGKVFPVESKKVSEKERNLTSSRDSIERPSDKPVQRSTGGPVQRSSERPTRISGREGHLANSDIPVQRSTVSPSFSGSGSSQFSGSDSSHFSGRDSQCSLKQDLIKMTTNQRSKHLTTLSLPLLMALDSDGSRYIQNKILSYSTADLLWFYDNIRNDLMRLSTDLFGNYVIQKIITWDGVSLSLEIMHWCMVFPSTQGGTMLYGDGGFGSMSYSHTLDNALLHAKESDTERFRILDIAPDLPFYIKDDAYAEFTNNFQKTNKPSTNDVLAIISNDMMTNLHKHTMTLCMDNYGCRVIQKVLESPMGIILYLQTISDNISTLIEDNNGNHVIQKAADITLQGLFSDNRCSSESKTAYSDGFRDSETRQGVFFESKCYSQNHPTRVIGDDSETKGLHTENLCSLQNYTPNGEDSTLDCDYLGRNTTYEDKQLFVCAINNRIQQFRKNLITLYTTTGTKYLNHRFGCRVIQKYIENCDDRELEDIISNCIIANIGSIITDQYGNYVLQHVLTLKRYRKKCLEVRDYGFSAIISETLANSNHNRVHTYTNTSQNTNMSHNTYQNTNMSQKNRPVFSAPQKLTQYNSFQNTTFPNNHIHQDSLSIPAFLGNKNGVFTKSVNLRDLIANPSLYRKTPWYSDIILQKFKTISQKELLTYSTHKFASNVVEKVIQLNVETIYNQLTSIYNNKPLIISMACDRYGNYVVQKILEQNNLKLNDILKTNAMWLRKSEYANHILTKLNKAYGLL